MLPPYLTDASIDALVSRALEEDVGPGDVTTQATVPQGRTAAATLTAKEAGCVAGLHVAARVFSTVDPAARFTPQVADGARVAAGTVVAGVHGPARALLTAERLALNILQRMSGIATATHRMVEAVGAHDVDILDTRKTAPGLRTLDKWAVRLGGGTNHRLGLHDLILIKDNHIAAAGGIAEALDAATRAANGRAIEIEVRTLDELDAVCTHGGAQIVLLDNMAVRTADGSVDTTRLQAAVERVGGRMRTEASGNVRLDTVRAIAATGVDAISSGALTHSVRALDLSMHMDLT
ncbi:carboxylating nicotinate-nucleotide diphosphorylase [Salisaeta longa]|uniref:carboxylating nicotinate-nucleotide diphosphorylase n=1 Tax=Salisaeta longa TaxID=503170 RepID=UPI0003B4E18F|nr:carboxylating nicotinate-nucleotide diphosphorylase [Salisaeta longa]